MLFRSLVAAAAGGHQAGHHDPLAQLVEKAVDNGDHIHIPRIDVAPLGRFLQKPNGEPGACFSHVPWSAPAAAISPRYRLEPDQARPERVPRPPQPRWMFGTMTMATMEGTGPDRPGSPGVKD
mgnify:CR=1 FL=1